MKVAACQLDDNQKYGLFKLLETKNMYDAGLEMGIDKYFKTPSGLRGYVFKVYSDIKNNPDKYAVDEDIYNRVVDRVTMRSGKKDKLSKDEASLTEQREELQIAESDVKNLILSSRNKAAMILMKKLKSIGTTKKKLKDISMMELAKVFGILFDKGQIIQGEATEHIAHLAKIDKNLTPEELLQTVVKQREHAVAHNLDE